MRRLLVCLHDATPALEYQSRTMTDIIMKRAGPSFTMLVIPDFHSGGRLDRFPRFCSWLRDLNNLGVEMALHGCTHLGSSSRGEAEFLGIGRKEAEKRIAQGLDILSTALGAPPAGFTAPAWRYSEGTIEALQEFRFKWVEHRSFIDHFEGGRLFSPVTVFSAGSALNRLLGRIWAPAAPVLFRPAVSLRVALHTRDLPLLRKQAESTLAGSVRGRSCTVVSRAVA